MTKQCWKKIDLKIVRYNKDETKGRVQFQFMKMPKAFRGPMLTRGDELDSYLMKLKMDIKQLESTPDSQGRIGYPMSTNQIRQIEARGHKLELDIQRAFCPIPTFSEIYYTWLKTQTRHNIFPAVRVKQIPFLESAIDSIEPEEIAKFFAVMRSWTMIRSNLASTEIPLKSSAIFSLQKTIRTVFRYAKRHGALINNPFELDLELIQEATVPTPPRRNKAKKLYFTFEQQELMFSFAREMDEETMRTWENEDVKVSGPQRQFNSIELLIRLGIWTGARGGDLLAANWSEFDHVMSEKKCTWTIKQRKHLSKHDFNDAGAYEVEINDFHLEDEGRLLELLQAAFQKSITGPKSACQHVITKLNLDAVSDDDDDLLPISKATAERSFKIVIGKVNEYLKAHNESSEEDPIDLIKSFNLHMMRHTMVSTIISGTGSWDTAQIRCGHQTIQTTIEIYGAMMNKTLKEFEVKRAAWIGEQMAEARVRIRQIKRTHLRSVK